VGSLHPGHSGAPILDANKHVLAVGNGGLQKFSSIGWAIPLERIHWQPVRGKSALTLLKQLPHAGLFAYDDEAETAEKRTLGWQQRVETHLESIEHSVATTNEEVRHVVNLLEEELHVKNLQIEFLQGQIAAGMIQPSKQAENLAMRIPDTADDYALALKAIANREYDKARTLLDRVALKKEQELVRIYYARGDMEFYSGHYKDAAVWHRKVEVFEPGNANVLAAVGSDLLHAGNYLDSGTFLEKSLKIREQELGPNDPFTGVSLNNLASLYEAEGQYHEAEPLYKRCSEIIERTLGPSHPNTAACFNNLGGLYFHEGKYSDAKSFFERALKIDEQAADEGNLGTACTLSNLAALYERQGKYLEAKPLIERALKLREKIQGLEHPDTASCLGCLARLYERQNKYTDAEVLYKQAIEIMQKALGPEHPVTISSLSNLAGLYQAEGRYADAESLYTSILKIREL
jgi:tetratricopeptide (TPR) repeat protein